MKLPKSLHNLALPQRRLIACAGILIFLAVYVAAVTGLATFIPRHPVVELLYYGTAGLLWGVPVIPLISWSEGYKRRKK